MARFTAAEKELEAEIVDVVQEANTFRQGWGGMIFATATEMAQAEKTREVVMSIPKIKAVEGEARRPPTWGNAADEDCPEKRIAKRKKYLPEQHTITASPPNGSNTATPSIKTTPPPPPTAQVATPIPVPSGDLLEDGAGSTKTSSPGSGSSTPSRVSVRIRA